MMKSINHDDFERARTPEKLQELLEERSSYFYMIEDLIEVLASLAGRSWEDFTDTEFRCSKDNGEAFSNIELKGYEAIEAGLELIRLIELWRGRHELGESAMLVERLERHRIGIMAVRKGEMIVHYNEVAGSESVPNEGIAKLAQGILKAASSTTLQAKLRKAA